MTNPTVGFITFNCDYLRVRKYCDIFENIEDFFDIHRAFANTLLKYKIYYQIVVCVCVLCILGEVLLSFTLTAVEKLSNTEKMLTAQVISQQNTRTVHIEKIKSSIKIV